METQNRVSTIAEKQFQCQKCDKSFSGPSALYNHNKSSHDGIKYPCTKCYYKATRKRSLQQHVEAFREGIKYPCTECNYKTTTKKSFQQHVAVVMKVYIPSIAINVSTKQDISQVSKFIFKLSITDSYLEQ